MNKLIKKLVESLFDDIDDIVNVNTQSSISNDIINNELKKLQKYNITEYPDSFTDIDLAEKLYDMANIYIKESLKNKYYTRYFNSKKDFQIKCKFKDYDESIDTDTVEIYGFNGHQNKFELTSILHVNGNVITDIIFNIGSPHYNIEFVPYDYAEHELFLSMFYLINTYIDNGYQIKNIILNGDEEIYRKTKDIIIGDDRRELYDENKVNPIKDEYISIYKKINIFFTINGENPLKLSRISKTVKFGHSVICENLKSFESFLLYIKKLGFNTFKMMYQPLMIDNSEYNGFKYGEDLFKQFLIDNNISNYNFSNKRDMKEILTIINNNVIKLLSENDKLDTSRLLYTSYTYDYKIIEKGKDEKGNFIILKYNLDYDDSNVKDHVYTKTEWKIYRSGLITLVNDDIFWSKMNK